MTIRCISRRRLLRHAALPLGLALAPAVIGKARAAAMKMRLSSSQANDPKYANGRVYYENLIRHVKANGLAEAVDPLTGDGDRAARRAIEASDQVQQRRFAAAGGPHHGDRLPRRDLECDRVDCWPSRTAVALRHVVYLH